MKLHVRNWLLSKINSLGLWMLFGALCLNLSGNSAEMINYSSDSTKTDKILTPAEMGIRNTTRWAYFVPGAGQLINHNYFKAACVWGGMAYGVKFLLDNTQDLKETRSELIVATTTGGLIRHRQHTDRTRILRPALPRSIVVHAIRHTWSVHSRCPCKRKFENL